MDNPKVSIIVPVYNVESYLAQCLDSLIEQTLTDIEILCLDDGSTDGSPELLDAYAAKDARIRALHRENCGVAETRNVGVGLARGEYILFVDSDDYIAKDLRGSRRYRRAGRRRHRRLWRQDVPHAPVGG